MSYIQRTLGPFFTHAAQNFPVLLLTGPRQVGKTTFLKHLSEPNRTYVTLDDPLVCQLAKNDPKLFMQRFRPPLLIDEIQYAPELLPFIKMSVDEDHKPGNFWLTGSQQFHLMQGVAESLAGRIGIVNMLGFSYRELTGHAFNAAPFLPNTSFITTRLADYKKLNLQDLYHHIWLGSFPATQPMDKDSRNLFYNSYIQTYLQRDVRDLAKVGDEMAFLRFLRATAARSAQLLNISDLARDTDVSPNTAKNWLTILQTSGIVYLLDAYHSNMTKRLVKAPKLYFLDTGLCAFLTEWSDPHTLETGAMSGAFLETWVFTELLKSYWHNGRIAPFYFYRDKDKKEIDLLIAQDNIFYPLEIKKTATPSLQVARQIDSLAHTDLTLGEGGVICLTDIFLPLLKNISAIPVGCL